MAKEIEILVELKTDFEIAKSMLGKFEFKGAKKTIDTYYFDPLRETLKPDVHNKLMECCRIREKADKYYVAYKVDKYDGLNWIYSDEYETEFEDLKALQHVFLHLGLKPLLTIDNTKYIYKNDQYEIVLEDVKDLGYFLEVEAIDEDENKSIEEIKKNISDFIQSLGLEIGAELNSGKPELLLLKNQIKT
jgi:adenylate cyclase class 2